MNTSSLDFISQLETLVQERKLMATDSSYTKTLFDRGTPYIAQKVGEEAVELAIAAVLGDPARTTSEAADLVYHLLVLLAANDLSLADVSAELAARHR